MTSEQSLSVFGNGHFHIFFQQYLTSHTFFKPQGPSTINFHHASRPLAMMGVSGFRQRPSCIRFAPGICMLVFLWPHACPLFLRDSGINWYPIQDIELKIRVIFLKKQSEIPRNIVLNLVADLSGKKVNFKYYCKKLCSRMLTLNLDS